MKTNSLILLVISFLSTSAWADTNFEPLMNKVTLQLTANQWITTKSALVNVAVNASVTDQAIEQMQGMVLNKLGQLAKGEWHIMSFNRSLDKSGLESIQILAQARLPQAELGNLRNNAKRISKPGETYTIDSVQFTPSDEEFRQGNIQLRNDIYQQTKNEIDTLNKNYPEQKYYLNRIDFGSYGPISPMPLNQMYMKSEALAAAPARPMNVGNKVELQASVILASLPTELLKTSP